LISTSDLAGLPDPASLRRVMQALAMLDAIVELDLPSDAIARVYRHEPLSPALLAALGSQRTFDTVALDAARIGYPIV
jgi:hypothetical protein